jgi:hypothetical protein
MNEEIGHKTFMIYVNWIHNLLISIELDDENQIRSGFV